MLPMLRPSQGAGLPTLSYPAKYADTVGDITYATVIPSISYVPADGRSVKAATYPAYAQKFNGSLGYYSQKLTDAATLPAASVATRGSAISSDAVYCAVGVASPSPLAMVYKISDTAVTFLTSIALPGTPYGPETMAFAPNGDYLFAGNNAAPYLSGFRRTPGADTFGGPMTVPSLGGLPITAVDVTDDGYVLAAQANSGVGFLSVFSIAPTALTKVGPTVFPIALPSEPLQIVRNKAGTRYAMRFAVSPYFKVLDYTSGGAFVDVTSPLAAGLNGPPNAIGMSPSGEFISMAFSAGGSTYGTVEVWRANVAMTQYTHYKSLKTLASNPGICTFSMDGRLLHASASNPNGATFYQPSNGSFDKLGEGNVAGWASNEFLQMRYSANSKAMLTVQSAAPWFAVYTAAPTMVDLPVPAYPAKGQGGTQLNPYIKVR